MPNQELLAIQAMKVPRHAVLEIDALIATTLEYLVITIAVWVFHLLRQLPFSEAFDKFKMQRIHIQMADDSFTEAKHNLLLALAMYIDIDEDG